MNTKVITHTIEREIRSMTSIHTPREISDKLNISYKTVSRYLKRNKLRALNGHSFRKGSNKPRQKPRPSPYVIPGIIREQLTAEKMLALKREKKFPSLELVMNAVCEYFDILVEDFSSKCRKRTLVWPRHIFFYLAYNMCFEATHKQVGFFVGGRDHTTAINGINVVKNLLSYDKDRQREVREIGGVIKNLLIKD